MNYKTTFDYIVDKYHLGHQAGYTPGKSCDQVIEIKNTNRETLAKLFAELNFTKGAEIGVEEGIYSEILLKANPKLHLICVDAWAAYEGYRDHMIQEEMDMIFRRATNRLEPYFWRNSGSSSCMLIKGYSVDEAKNIEDESLDFVYIDANHEFVNVVNDIAAWERKVKVGGIIAGHDYIKRKTNAYLMHVPYALAGYTSAYQIKPLFLLGRKDVKANTNPNRGELRDSTRSWFYVKQPRLTIVPGHKWA